jgi:hypothetical protein
MKTKDANRNSLSGKKLAIYVAAVAAFCFLNSLALQASDYVSDPFSKGHVEQTTIQDPQSSYHVRNWLNDFQYQLLTVIIRNRTLKTYYAQSGKAGTKAPSSKSCAERHSQGNIKVKGAEGIQKDPQ